MTDTVREQTLAIRAEGTVNMLDTWAVQQIAFEKGFYELVNFIETDLKGYARFILSGKTE